MEKRQSKLKLPITLLALGACWSISYLTLFKNF